MSGKACSLCLRDECERCHDPNCLCCGIGGTTTSSWWDRDIEDYEFDGPVAL